MIVRFVTGNRGKAKEAAEVLAAQGVQVEAVSAHVPEIQADSLEEVALAKAEALRGRIRAPYFVEDAGLFIDGLKGFPGVYSSYVFRTLGNAGVLELLRKAPRRGARFRAVAAFVGGSDPPRLFVGECRGAIAPSPRGVNGFGFDPIFVPRGGSRSFAQMDAHAKSHRSHRGRALRSLARFLRSGSGRLVPD